jgi:hypothetical protein
LHQIYTIPDCCLSLSALGSLHQNGNPFPWGFHVEAINLWYRSLPQGAKQQRFDHVWCVEDDVGFTGPLSTLISSYAAPNVGSDSLGCSNSFSSEGKDASSLDGDSGIEATAKATHTNHQHLHETSEYYTTADLITDGCEMTLPWCPKSKKKGKKKRGEQDACAAGGAAGGAAECGVWGALDVARHRIHCLLCAGAGGESAKDA